MVIEMDSFDYDRAAAAHKAMRILPTYRMREPIGEALTDLFTISYTALVELLDKLDAIKEAEEEMYLRANAALSSIKGDTPTMLWKIAYRACYAAREVTGYEFDEEETNEESF